MHNRNHTRRAFEVEFSDQLGNNHRVQSFVVEFSNITGN